MRFGAIAITAACLMIAGVVAGLVLRDRGEDAPAPAPAASSAAAMPSSSPPAGSSEREAAADEGDRREPEHRGSRFLLELPRRGHPVVIVRRDQTAPLRAAPGARIVREVGPRTRYGSDQAFSVVERRGAWVGVPSPYRENGELGWLRLDRRRLRAASTPYEIRVDLSSFRTQLVRGDRVLKSFPVTIGADASPTPTGRFAVTDTFRGNLNPAYGCCAVAITARQPNLPSGWLGGDRIAFHGTSGTLGAAISNGCVRARDPDVSLLVDHAGVGTPVLIHE
jgi:lipoprotein-anchoring transpeptidase ErfK/SrfK